jgi:tetratricopeptide (TPR) repeat protein
MLNNCRERLPMRIFDLNSETHLSECRIKAFAFMTLLILILCIYSNTFQASWHFDDEPNILKAKALHLNSLNWSEIKKVFFHEWGDSEKLYRPVSRLSFALNYYFGKANVFGYHVVNMSIHMLAALFLFLFILHTLNLPLLRAKYGPNSYSIALLATVLWAINPIQTQAVTYIVQRMASMAGLFYIMAMYFYLRGRTTNSRSLSSVYFCMCLLSSLLAFGTKENSFVLPITLLLYDIFIIQSDSWESKKRILKIATGVIVLTLFTSLVYYYLSRGNNFLAFLDGYDRRIFGLKERLLTEPRIILFYISLILYPMPTRLSLVHDIQISSSLFDPFSTIVSIVFIIFIVLTALFLSTRRPLLSFCVLFFFLNHVIESSIFALELIFEHRNYIPSMLIFLPVAILMLRVIRLLSYKKPMQAIVTGCIVVIIIAFGHSTFIRNFTWKNEETLWIDGIEKAPDVWRPYHGLAKYYSDHHHKDKALSLYKTALTKKPIVDNNDKAITYYNLGLEYYGTGNQDLALEYYLQATKIDPYFADAHNNIGILLANKREYGQAYQAFKTALSSQNNCHYAHSNLGFLLLKMGKWEEALKELKAALDIVPYNIPTQQRLGVAYKERGEFSEALMYFKRVLKEHPRHLTTLLFTGETYWLMGNIASAEKTMDTVIQIIAEDKVRWEDLVETGDSFDILLPDMDILLPLLADAYKRKAEYYLEKSEYCAQAATRNK